MITLTRREARHLRAVFRRSTLGVSHRGALPPLVFHSDAARLKARIWYCGLAVESIVPNRNNAYTGETIALPLDALADVEGRDESLVVLEALGDDRTRVRWDDRHVPQSREYAVSAIDVKFPEPPASFTTMPPGLLDALAEASATAVESSPRYALNCVQLKGATGALVATDGRQMLLQNGFHFPWSDDVLVKGMPLFACKELPRDQTVSVGKTDTHVVFRVAHWTLFCPLQEGRYPCVDRVIPVSGGAATRLQLDGADADFLSSSLDRLPGGDEMNSPATVDLNGCIAVRARGAESSPTTELILTRSGYTGAPLRFSINRDLLGRAVRLGFRSLEAVDATTPVVCRDGRRVYAVQPLEKDSALAPDADAVRIESDAHVGSTSITSAPVKARILVSQRATPVANNNPVAVPEPAAGATGLAALIQEVESLHDLLGGARSRAGRLVVALRKHRRRERLVQTTLASLRQLKLQEVAE
jgi:hypothetical protein